MKKVFNICNIYIILWILYDFHWMQAELPGITNLSNIFLGINLCISIYYTIEVFIKNNLSPFFKGVNLLLAMFVVYGVLHIIIGGNYYVTEGDAVGTPPIRNGSYLIGSLRTLLPIYTFFIFTQKGWITVNNLRFWFFVFFAALIIAYTHRINFTYERENVNNIGYWFLYLMPYAFLFEKNKLLKYIIIGVLMMFILMCLKRGAILLGIILTTMIIWKDFSDKSVSYKKKIVTIAAIVLFLVIGFYFAQEFISSSALFEKRLEATKEGRMSGRNEIWANILYVFLHDSHPIQILFGRGADGTLLIGSNFAHNDWLEVLCDNGLIGIIIYILFWAQFVKQLRITPRCDSKRDLLLASFIICFGQTLFSMFYNSMPMYITILIGYALSRRTNVNKSSLQ